MNEITTEAELDALPIGSVVEWVYNYMQLFPREVKKSSPNYLIRSSGGAWMGGTSGKFDVSSRSIFQNPPVSLREVYRPDQQPTAQPTAEDVRDELAGWPIGHGYYQTQVSVDDAAGMAATVLALLPGRPESVIKAEALREAARWMQDGIGEAWDGDPVKTAQLRHEAAARRKWLRDRADEIEDGQR